MARTERSRESAASQQQDASVRRKRSSVASTARRPSDTATLRKSLQDVEHTSKATAKNVLELFKTHYREASKISDRIDELHFPQCVGMRAIIPAVGLAAIDDGGEFDPDDDEEEEEHMTDEQWEIYDKLDEIDWDDLEERATALRAIARGAGQRQDLASSLRAVHRYTEALELEVQAYRKQYQDFANAALTPRFLSHAVTQGNKQRRRITLPNRGSGAAEPSTSRVERRDSAIAPTPSGAPRERRSSAVAPTPPGAPRERPPSDSEAGPTPSGSGRQPRRRYPDPDEE